MNISEKYTEAKEMVETLSPGSVEECFSRLILVYAGVSQYHSEILPHLHELEAWEQKNCREVYQEYVKEVRETISHIISHIGVYISELKFQKVFFDLEKFISLFDFKTYLFAA